MSDNFLKDFEWESYETLKSQYVKLYDEYMKLKKRSNEQYGISYFIHKQIMKDYISKDKIREKITFLESQFDEGIEDYNNQFIIDCVGILEELLEEND